MIYKTHIGQYHIKQHTNQLSAVFDFRRECFGGVILLLTFYRFFFTDQSAAFDVFNNNHTKTKIYNATVIISNQSVSFSFESADDKL